MVNFYKILGILMMSLIMTGCLGGGGGGGDDKNNDDNKKEIIPPDYSPDEELIKTDDEKTIQITPEMEDITRSVNQLEGWKQYSGGNPEWENGYYPSKVLSSDPDGDGIITNFDNCPLKHNLEQLDMDDDGRGNLCDDDIDGDKFSNEYEKENNGDPRDKDSIAKVFEPYKNDYSEWSATGTIKDKGEWTPVLDDQQEKFEQKRTNEEQKERTVYIQEKDRYSDKVRVVDEKTETQYFEFEQTRTIRPKGEPSKEFLGDDCRNVYSNSGEDFYQKYICHKVYDATYEFVVAENSVPAEQANKVKGDVVGKSTAEIREKQPVITYDLIEPKYTSWEKTGEYRDRQEWTPSVDEKIQTFTQYADAEEKEIRDKTKRKKRRDTEQVFDISTEQEEQWVDVELSRTVEAIKNEWKEGETTCTDWTPDPEQYEKGEKFTQTRTCTTMENREVEMQAGQELLAVKTETQEADVVQEKRTKEGEGYPADWKTVSGPSIICSNNNEVQCFENTVNNNGPGPYIDKTDKESGLVVEKGGDARCLNEGEKGWQYEQSGGSTILKPVMCGGGSWGGFEGRPRDCSELLYKNPNISSGRYIINPTGNKEFEAYCDMNHDGGGWTRIGKRINHFESGGGSEPLINMEVSEIPPYEEVRQPGFQVRHCDGCTNLDWSISDEKGNVLDSVNTGSGRAGYHIGYSSDSRIIYTVNSWGVDDHGVGHDENAHEYVYVRRPSVIGQSMEEKAVQSTSLKVDVSDDTPFEKAHKQEFIHADNAPDTIGVEKAQSLFKNSLKAIDVLKDNDKFWPSIDDYQQEDEQFKGYGFTMASLNTEREQRGAVKSQCDFEDESTETQILYHNDSLVNDMVYNTPIKYYRKNDAYEIDYDKCGVQSGKVRTQIESGLARFPSEEFEFRVYDVTESEREALREEVLLPEKRGAYTRVFDEYEQKDYAVNGELKVTYDGNLEKTTIANESALLLKKGDYEAYVDYLSVDFKESDERKVDADIRAVLKDTNGDYYYSMEAKSINDQPEIALYVGNYRLNYRVVKQQQKTTESGCEHSVLTVEAGLNTKAYNKRFNVPLDEQCTK